MALGERGISNPIVIRESWDSPTFWYTLSYSEEWEWYQTLNFNSLYTDDWE
jgi:hypothetical protein